MVAIQGTPNTSLTTTVTIPTHAVGDDIYICAYTGLSTTTPTKPAAAGTVPAWVDIDNNAGANTNAMRTAHFVANATNHTSGTWTGAGCMIAVVVRGQNATPVGGHAESGGSSTTTTAPAITLTKTDGTSLELCFHGERLLGSGGWEAAPAGYTRQATAGVTANTPGLILNTKDSTTSDGAVDNACNRGAVAAGYRGATIEVLAIPGASNLFFHMF